MSLRVISTDKAPSAVGPYSQAIEAGKYLYTSGVLPIDMSNGKLVESDIFTATKVCMENIIAILEEAGYALDNVVKTMIYIVDMEEFSVVNEAYETYFKDHKPARSCVEVSKLPKGAEIEIEVIAYKE